MTKKVFDNAASSHDSKVTENKTKNMSIENELKKLKIFDLGYFIGKCHFEYNDVQNYLVFQLIRRYVKTICNTKFISSCKSRGLSDETITHYASSHNSLTPLIDYY